MRPVLTLVLLLLMPQLARGQHNEVERVPTREACCEAVDRFGEPVRWYGVVAADVSRFDEPPFTVGEGALWGAVLGLGATAITYVVSGCGNSATPDYGGCAATYLYVGTIYITVGAAAGTLLGLAVRDG